MAVQYTDVSVQVPQGLSKLGDVIVQLVGDVKDKDYGQLLADALAAVQQYKSISDLKDEVKDPAVVMALAILGLALYKKFSAAQPAIAAAATPAQVAPPAFL